jgi:hypothetical protein
MKKSRINALITIFIWVIIIFSFGIWRHWWQISLTSIGISLLIISSFIYTAFKNKTTGYPVLSQEEVFKETERISLGQSRALRHLVYKASPLWESERKDDGMWTALVFYVDSIALIIRIGVKFTNDKEDTSLKGLQSFAKTHYEQQLGGILQRNEISSFANHPSVITECSFKNGGKVLRYSFTIHGNEYCVQFTFGTEEWFNISKAFCKAFEENCSYIYPKFKLQSILNHRITINIPSGFIEVSEKTEISSWEGKPGPLKIRIFAINENTKDKITIEYLKKFPGFSERHGMKELCYRMEELGLIIYRYGNPKNEKWAIDVVRLASGLTVMVETDHQGTMNDLIGGFYLEPLRRSIIASIKDNSIQII